MPKPEILLQANQDSKSYTFEEVLAICKSTFSSNNQALSVIQSCKAEYIGNEVKITLQAHSQQTCFDKEISPVFLPLLKEKLQNKDIHFTITIEETKVEKKPYSNKEKYEYMVSRNPMLDTLINKFDLEI